MPRYDSEQFDPPAPIAEVKVGIAQTAESIPDVKLLLDSGADVTLLPVVEVTRLGLVPDQDQRYELAGFDGQRSFADSVVLDVTFLEKTFRGRPEFVGQKWFTPRIGFWYQLSFRCHPLGHCNFVELTQADQEF